MKLKDFRSIIILSILLSFFSFCWQIFYNYQIFWQDPPPDNQVKTVFSKLKQCICGLRFLQKPPPNHDQVRLGFLSTHGSRRGKPCKIKGQKHVWQDFQNAHSIAATASARKEARAGRSANFWTLHNLQDKHLGTQAALCTRDDDGKRIKLWEEEVLRWLMTENTLKLAFIPDETDQGFGILESGEDSSIGENDGGNTLDT